MILIPGEFITVTRLAPKCPKDKDTQTPRHKAGISKRK